jgi:hypothetical protein
MRSRGWLTVHYLATTPEFAGRFRIFLNNLQQGGDEGVAARTAFNLPAAELAKRLEAYSAAGQFEAVPASGRPLNPNRDFLERELAEAAVAELLSELKAAGRSFPPESPRGLAAKNTRASLELAISANPKWAQPHAQLAALETNSTAKVKAWKSATALDPRNAAYWQALAEAQAEAGEHTDAAKSWASAMRSAATAAERERLQKIQRDAEERRTEFEIAERRRQAGERAQDLERLKQAAAAEIHAAEAKANREQGGLKSDVAPVKWWSDEKGEPVSGSLTHVDCGSGSLKLTVAKAGGGNVVLLVRDPSKLVVRGSEEASFACGAQRPARKIALEHNAKPDAQFSTSGDVLSVEFP